MTSAQAITFIALIRHFADQLGNAQFPLNESATGPVALVSPTATHCALLQRVVARLYVENAASSFHSPISLYPCLDALGKERGRLLRNQGDLDQITLIDQMGELLLNCFDALSHPRTPPQNTSLARSGIATGKTA